MSNRVSEARSGSRKRRARSGPPWSGRRKTPMRRPREAAGGVDWRMEKNRLAVIRTTPPSALWTCRSLRRPQAVRKSPLSAWRTTDTPFRHAGDKNFWLDIFRGLKRLGHELRIVSAMVEDVPDDGLPLVRVPPIPIHFRPDQRMNLSHNHLAGTNNYLSKTISLPRLVRAVRRVRSEFRPDVIHFVQNYGPATLALRPAFTRIPMTISAPTYQPNQPPYALFIEPSFAPFDTIVPFSDAYQRRLMELRYRPDRVRMIRWGIDTERFSPPTAAARETARKELGLSQDTLVSFWPGFIQQTTADEFHAAQKTANLVLDRDPSKFAFLFCFKPEHFKESFQASERPGLRVFGSAEALHAARLAADVFLSPIQDAQ